MKKASFSLNWRHNFPEETERRQAVVIESTDRISPAEDLGELEGKIRTYDLASSLFWLLCGMLIILFSVQLPLGTIDRPGPGLIPFLLGMLLDGLALVLFFGSLAQKGKGKTAQPFWSDRARGKKVIWAVVSMVVYAFVLNYLGFVTATFLLMFFLFKMIFTLKWTVALGAALLTLLLTYLLFIAWLEIQLPSGPFGI